MTHLACSPIRSLNDLHCVAYGCNMSYFDTRNDRGFGTKCSDFIPTSVYMESHGQDYTDVLVGYYIELVDREKAWGGVGKYYRVRFISLDCQDRVWSMSIRSQCDADRDEIEYATLGRARTAVKRLVRKADEV